MNRRLIDSIQQCNDLIIKMREDCIVPADKFCGGTASALKSIRQDELDRIIETCKLLNIILQEEM